MQLIRSGLLVLAAGLSSTVLADAKSHEASIHRFFKAAEMSTLIDDTLTQMTDMQIQANPAMTPYRDTMLAFFKKHMSWGSLEPEITKLYMAEFTESEIVEITKFYETPIGRKVMKKLPQLSAQGAAIGQTRVQQNIGELQAMIETKRASIEEKERAATAAKPAP